MTVCMEEKSMKKILVNIFLILSIVLPYTCIHAENSAEVKHKESIDFLTKLGIISIVDSNEDFSSEKYVTREEFCVYLSRAFKIDVTSDARQIFSDVPADSALAPYVNALYDRGIVSGFGGTFRPTDVISYSEAVKLIVSTLNYDYAADMGGYPTGYHRIASDIGITEDVSIADKLTKAETAQLIYNAMTAPFMTLDHIQGANAVFKSDSDKSTLTELYDIYKGKGVILANGQTSLVTGNIPSGTNEVMIGDVIYDVGTTNVANLIGHYIEFYYVAYEDDRYEVFMVIKDKSEELVIKHNQIIDFDNGTYTYETSDGKTKKARLDSDFLISYNFSCPIIGFDPSMMIPTMGRVRLIDSGKGNGYSAVLIENYENYVVDSVDVQGEIIYSKNNTPLPLNNVECCILNENGKEISFSDIREWNIVSVLTSSDRNKVVAYVSDNFLEGNVSRIGGNDDSSIVIGTEEYAVASNVLSKIELGKVFKFYLDYNGIIAGIYKSAENDMKYAYLYKKYVDTENVEERVQVKLFEEDGTQNTYYLAKNVKINDVSMKKWTPEDIVNNALNLSINLVKFQTNDKGEIKALYVYDSSSDKYIHKMFDGKAYWNLKQRSFSGKVTMQSNTPVFVIPDGYGIEDYQVRDLSSYENDKEVTVTVYTTGDNVYGDVIVRNSIGVDYNRPLAIVKKVKHTVDDYGDLCTKLVVLYNSEEREYILEKEEILGDVDVGDVIKISLNHLKEINNILHIYDYDAQDSGFKLTNPYEPQTGAGYRSRNRCYFGYAYDKTDGLLKYSMTLPSGGELPQTENALLSSFRIYVIEGERDIRVGDEKDIQDYTSAGSNCSRIIVSTMWGDPEDIVIIK